MSGRRTTTPTAGRNDPCPCGSGRKFKRCCGAAPPRQSTTNRRTSALSPISAVSDPDEWSDGLGPLTEVSRLRRSAEEFIRMQSALPDASLGSGGAPAVEHEASPERRVAARRYRERGIRLVEAGRLPAAVSAFQRAIELDPGEADSHRVLGQALLRLDRLSEAAASLSLATTLRDDADAYYDLGVTQQRQGLDREAMAAYRRAVELAPRIAKAACRPWRPPRTGWRRRGGRGMLPPRRNDRPRQRGGHVEPSQSTDVGGEVWGGRDPAAAGLAAASVQRSADEILGDVLVRQGRFAEANEAFDRVLDLNPRLISAHFTAVEARKCTETDRPRLTRMLAALDDPALHDEDRVLLHFAIGKLSDDLGDYAVAMRHFDLANRIGGRNDNFDAPAFSADIDRLIRRFTPNFFAANAAFGRDDEAPLFIVGLPRSGTTLVEQIISSHPQVARRRRTAVSGSNAPARWELPRRLISPPSGRTTLRENISRNCAVSDPPQPE